MKEMVTAESSPDFSFDGLVESDFGENDRKFSPESRYRYTVLTAENGTRYFSKQLAGNDEASDQKWSSYLEREAIWATFADSVGHANPDLSFTGLSPLHTEGREDGGVQRLIYPFIDAPFLAEPTTSTPLRDPYVLSRYIKTLRALDVAAEAWHTVESTGDDGEHTPFDQLDKSWGEWLEKGRLLDEAYMTSAMVQSAHKLVGDYAGFVTPRLQHGDFVPWHLFARQSGEWISFDGEHASSQKPRYYDLAYSYSRLFTKSRDSNLAARMLGGFIVLGEQEGDFTREEFYNAFVPVLMSRSMGMFLDAANDGKKGDNYLDEANNLFMRCQARDLRALLA